VAKSQIEPIGQVTFWQFRSAAWRETKSAPEVPVGETPSWIATVIVQGGEEMGTVTCGAT
jgi:hypothetical protein